MPSLHCFHVLGWPIQYLEIWNCKFFSFIFVFWGFIWIYKNLHHSKISRYTVTVCSGNGLQQLPTVMTRGGWTCSRPMLCINQSHYTQLQKCGVTRASISWTVSTSLPVYMHHSNSYQKVIWTSEYLSGHTPSWPLHRLCLHWSWI